MDNGVYSFSYGKKKIEYLLFYAERKTLEIAVHPDCSIVVKAPIDSLISTIEVKLKKRIRWILRQVFYFSQFSPKTTPRYYISGESHLYLGRQYRLKIRRSEERSIKLKQGYFQIGLPDVKDIIGVRKLLDQWYLEKSDYKFNELLADRWQQFKRYSSIKPTLRTRKMKTRWGSLSKNKTLTLNPELIRAPKECIDYVIIHELCHLMHQNHNSEFYQLLDSILPDWKRRKHRLEFALI